MLASRPEASRARAAAVRASWLRWAALRVSCSTACGAASLASTASRVARASGVRYPVIGDMPSWPCLPMVMPRRRARSSSVKSPSGLQAVGEFVGQLGQLVGAMLAAQPGQLRLGLHPGFHVDEVGQPVPKTTDHRHVAGPDVAVALGGGGGRQHRRQRFAGDRLTRRPDRWPRGCAATLRRD